MKTTIDIPETIYRKVKAKSALEGRPVRDVAITLFTTWVERVEDPQAHSDEKPSKVADKPAPRWFASLHKYAHNARGQYDMAGIRQSIANGRAREEKPS